MYFVAQIPSIVSVCVKVLVKSLTKVFVPNSVLSFGLKLNEILFSYSLQRAGIAAGGIFYNVQPGTAAQLKI